MYIPNTIKKIQICSPKTIDQSVDDEIFDLQKAAQCACRYVFASCMIAINSTSEIPMSECGDI